MRAAALSVLCALLLDGCRDSGIDHDEPEKPPNVILISIDTLRADHLGSYGYPRPTSPFLDQLAAGGVRFASAFSPASWTLPAHMSLFTGCYPQSHGVEQDEKALPAGLATLTETFDEAGYETAGFVSWTYLKAAYGFGRGFDLYRELLPPVELQDSETDASIRAEDFVDEVLSWLDQRAAGVDAGNQDPSPPLFLFLHLFDPHMGYRPPLETARLFDPDLDSVEGGTYRELSRYVDGLHADAPAAPREVVERATVLYDAEIRYTDDQLRRLFARLEATGILDSAIVAVTSDHGEELDDHGSMEGHQWTLYDEVLHVPMILQLTQGRGAGLVVERQVELTDLAPTLLDLAGLDPLPNAEGRSLVPLIDAAAAGEASGAGLYGGTGLDWPEIAFSHIRRFNKKVAVRTPDHKLIYTEDTGGNLFGNPVRPGFELYDLVADPGEQLDLFEPDLPIARALARTLQEMLASRQSFETTDAPELSEEELERLRSLGYVDRGSR